MVARDDTVKCQWRTLQLPLGEECRGFGGAQVEVLEHPGGRLQVRHQGDIIPSRQTPPRPGAIRAPHGALATTPELGRIVKRLGNHRLSPSHLRRLADLEPDPVAEGDDHTVNHGSETQFPTERELTHCQPALWRAVQHPRIQGFFLRKIARQSGISRNTVHKYSRGLTRPTNRPHNHGARR